MAAVPAKELKDYSMQELEEELERRHAGKQMSSDEVREFWLQAAGILQGVDIDSWLADVRRERDAADPGENE